MRDPNLVQIFDTTLRDGEQCPGATMTLEEKLRIASKLEDLGIDIIEAGFPAASPGEILAVQEISQAVTRPEIAALTRTSEPDIRAAQEALKFAKNPRLHVFIATSDIHLQYKLKMTREEVLRQIAFGVKTCASIHPMVEFSAEDATRTDLGFLKEAFACALENGASVLNIPDTVGYTLPAEYVTMVSAIKALTDGKDIVISTHCHDDLGLAVANSLAAIGAGARQVEGCINGIGERAGNAALEEVIMALKTRQDLLKCHTNIDTRKLLSTSHLVSTVIAFPIPPNKAVVGRNAFAHEAGIHQHGMLKERKTYEIMEPTDVGYSASNLVLGKHSGRHALLDRLEHLGYTVSQVQLNEVFEKFKLLADRKKTIFDDDLHALMANTGLKLTRYFALRSIDYRSGTTTVPHARISLTVDGVEVEGAEDGDGPVNAAFEAIKKITALPDVVLEDYSISAVTEGSDALGQVLIRIANNDIVSHGQSTGTDIVVASVEAFIDALNHYMYQRGLRQYTTDALLRSGEQRS